VNGIAPENHDHTSKTSERNCDLRGRAKSFARFHRIYVKQSCHTMAVCWTP